MLRFKSLVFASGFPTKNIVTFSILLTAQNINDFRIKLL